MNRGALVLAVLAALAAGACRESKVATSGKGAGGSRAFRVTAGAVAARPLTYAVDAIGSLEAYQVVAVPARVEGTLERLAFDVGAKVTPETVLAVIDERRHALWLEQAQSALAEARAAADEAKAAVSKAAAQTARVRAELEEATSSLARWRGLREKNPGWVTEEKIAAEEARSKSLAAQLDEAAAGEDEAAAAARAMASAAESRAAAVALAEKNAADARVRAPIAGVVETKHVAAGQYVKVGDRIATLVDTRELRLRFTVGESESVQLRTGQRVAFRVSAFGRRDFEADLFHVAATADPVSRMVECLAVVKDADPALRPGFFASVRVEIDRKGGAIVVPEGSLLPTEEGFVAFAIEEGKAVRKPVVLGLHTKDGGVEVVEGLREGERIALKGAQALQDGVAVEVVEE